MTKSNKKMFTTILIYVGILAAVIMLFIGGMHIKSTKSVQEIYRAKATVLKGADVSSITADSLFEKVQVSNGTIDTMRNGDFVPVFNLNEIVGQKALNEIPRGTFLGREMFGVQGVSSVLDEYRGDPDKGKFVNPYYSVLKTDKLNAPISGFKVGQNISIEGTVALNNSTDENLAGDLNEVYNGILTNKCIVHNIIKDSDGNITNVGVIVELKDYPTINFFQNYGTLKFHEGKADDEKWETTNNKILTELWEKTGFKDTIAKKLNTHIEFKDQNSNNSKLILAKYNGSEIDPDTKRVNYTTIIANLDSKNNGVPVKLFTPYSNFIVSHYNLDGTIGADMDITGVNTVKTFNSRTGLYEIDFVNEGVYDFFFYEKVAVPTGEDGKTQEKIALVNKIHLIIEKEPKAQKVTDASITVNAKFDSDGKATNGDLKFNLAAFKNTDNDEMTQWVYKDYHETFYKETGENLAVPINLGDPIKNILGGGSFITSTKQALGDFNGVAIENLNFCSFPLFLSKGSKEVGLDNKEKLTLLQYLGIVADDLDEVKFVAALNGELKPYAEKLNNISHTDYITITNKIKELTKDGSKETMLEIYGGTKKEPILLNKGVSRTAYLYGTLIFGVDPAAFLRDKEFSKNLFNELNVSLTVELANGVSIGFNNFTIELNNIAE